MQTTTIPAQGETLKSDLVIAGAKVYSDASWKCKKIPGGIGATGIGVFLQYMENGKSYNVMVQASVRQAKSVLQAEADAMLLGTKLAELLNINEPTLLTDNQILAKAMASKRLDNPHLHWNARQTFAQILNSTSRTNAQVFHIKRDSNGVAHNCAHQVLRQSLGQPIYSCVCSAHSSPSCHVISILQHVSWQDYVIHAVLCT